MPATQNMRLQIAFGCGYMDTFWAVPASTRTSHSHVTQGVSMITASKIVVRYVGPKATLILMASSSIK